MRFSSFTTYLYCRMQNIKIHYSTSSKRDPTVSKSLVSCSIAWKVDTGKCVDASPLMVLTKRVKSKEEDKLPPSSCLAMEEIGGPYDSNLVGEDVMIYVGSHSHLFLAVELSTGRVVWQKELGDRVESSACISSCGKFVVVGMLYFHK